MNRRKEFKTGMFGEERPKNASWLWEPSSISKSNTRLKQCEVICETDNELTKIEITIEENTFKTSPVSKRDSFYARTCSYKGRNFKILYFGKEFYGNIIKTDDSDFYLYEFREIPKK